MRLCTSVKALIIELSSAAMEISQLHALDGEGSLVSSSIKRLKVAISYGEVYYGCIGSRRRFFFNILSETVTTAGRLLGYMGEGRVAIQEDAATYLKAKRRQVLRDSRSRSFDGFESIRYRKSVLSSVDRIERFKFSLLRQELIPTKSFSDGVSPEEMRKIETFEVGNGPRSSVYRPIGDS